MEIFDKIKQTIDAVINSNGKQEITGRRLNSVLKGMVSSTEVGIIQMDDAVSKKLEDKVDKVNGKQLSTEDFTTALKNKLEGLSNYDDTAIQNAVNELAGEIDTLVNGDASKAIESFNEIIAFLEGVEDSENLDSIIAAIEQQIAAKQDKIDDLDDIRSGAAKGATALQSIPSEYVTESELNTAISNAITNALNTEV